MATRNRIWGSARALSDLLQTPVHKVPYLGMLSANKSNIEVSEQLLLKGGGAICMRRLAMATATSHLRAVRRGKAAF